MSIKVAVLVGFFIICVLGRVSTKNQKAENNKIQSEHTKKSLENIKKCKKVEKTLKMEKKIGDKDVGNCEKARE